MSTFDYDVAVVGYGPAGAALANLLGPSGLRVLVADREPGPIDLPRAVHFDGEVMRVFQSMGVAHALAEHVRRSAGMVYFDPAGEKLLERLPSDRTGAQGWFDNYLFHQPFLEATLRNGARRFSNVEVRLSTEVLALGEEGEGAWLDMRSADGAARRVTARWVVGCDGARSLVRQSVGGGLDDLGLHQPWLVVDVVLKRPVPGLPAYTIQFCEPTRPTTYVNVVGTRRRWEIMLMPGDDPVHVADESNVWRLLSRWLTPADAVIERRAVYTFHSLIADRWRRGPFLIAGDAAHQTPPFLGQGMCAGIRDAANLAWKLELVARGRASSALLDTYATEREPHVREFIALAVRLGDIIQTTDPEVAAARDRKFREGGTEAMANLSPTLGPGLRVGAAPAGEILPQPRLDDGRLLDEALGRGFAVVGSATTIAQVSPRTRSAWAAIGASIVDEPGSGARHWLGERGLQAVIVRPDRYVAGGAHDAASLDALTASVAARLYGA